MNILVMGGGQLVGWHIVRTALDRGHAVTLFNRGKTNPGEFPGVERVLGDRDGGLAPLAERTFDAVVDCCGFHPAIVRQSAELLRDRVGHYTFISTESVYPEMLTTDIDESAPLVELPPPIPATFVMEAYGGLKVLCERVVREVYGARALIVRPGMVVGPRDHTDRFTHWVRRAAQPGEMLVPGPPERRTQVIDARDLAAFVLDRTAARDDGIYNASGPAESLRFDAVVSACLEAGGHAATPVWVDHAWLAAAGATGQELPFWFSDEADPSVPGELEISSRRGIAAGLRFRPLLDTVRDILAWDRVRPADFALRPGPLDAARERELLAAWRARTPAG